MTPATTERRAIPEVYVLWHPDCSIGEFLASGIYQWLRPGVGLGPDVFFRSAPRSGAADGALPLPLPGEVRGQAATPPMIRSRRRDLVNLQIVIPLIDSHMVADPTWQHWLSHLADTATATNRVFLPVALESCAFNVPTRIARQNFLRPGGLPLSPDPTPGEREVLRRSLCKQLTEALCAMLLGRAPDHTGRAGEAQETPASGRAADSKVMIFLSHAKVDGSRQAGRIRDYIYTSTQLAAFYDENDIPFGSGFSQIIESTLSGARTAALIVVRSAAYARRPWCRREISSFRRPLADPTDARLWRLNPVFIVDALQGGEETFEVPEFGNASIIGWSDTHANIEEQIVTSVLRDALLRNFHASLGRHLFIASPDRLVINWVPDPTTLLLVGPVHARPNVEVCYPGKGLSALELDILGDYFPAVTFTSYEQALSS